MENKIESFAELENALKNLTVLSEEINKTFNDANSAYERQNQAWSSANSQKQVNKMMDYSLEAVKIAKNTSEVSEAINKFKTTTRNIDEQQ